MNNSTVTRKHVIASCGCDFLLPFAMVYLFYIILHGHLSPGGGFQGGVLMVAMYAMMYLGYGREKTIDTLNVHGLHTAEGIASIIYVLIAVLGVALGGNFCQNVLFNQGNIGELWSSGTILLMNVTVGAKVLTGVGVLAIYMLAVLKEADEES